MTTDANDSKKMDALHGIPPWHRQSWMGDLKEQLKALAVTDICMIGTHNSGTCNIDRSSPFAPDAPGLLRKKGASGTLSRFFSSGPSASWSRCQSMTIAEQLNYGIRYLDFRVVPNRKAGKEPYLSHAHVSISLREAISDVLLFLKSSESAEEIIVIDFQRILGFDESAIEEQFFAHLSPLLPKAIPASTDITTPLGALYDASGEQRVFVLMDRAFDASRHPWLRPRRRQLISDWKDTASVDELLEALHTDVCNARNGRKGLKKMFVTQGVLTPDGGDIAKGMFLVGAETSIRDLAEKVNSHLLEWFWQRNACCISCAKKITDSVGNTHGNILMMDFPEIGVYEARYDGASLMGDAVTLCVYINHLRSARW